MGFLNCYEENVSRQMKRLQQKNHYT